MSSERTEEPTEQKLKDAQGKGQVLRAQELQQAVSLAVALWALSQTGAALTRNLMLYLRSTLRDLGQGSHLDLADFSWYSPLLGLCLRAFLPILFVSGVAGAMLALFLTKGKLKASLLPEDMQRFNLFSAAGRWFSKQTAVELVRMTLKVIVLFYATNLTYQEFGDAVTGLRLSHSSQAQAVAGFMETLTERLLALSLLIGGLDLLYQRWDYMKGLMMSKTEIKDEHKKSEGDPMVKFRRRSFGRKLIKKSGINRLPEASVLITNPTHYAVALKYDATMAAPQVICKGVDNLALEIRRQATALGLHIVEDKPLARALYRVDLDTYIPEELFEAAARVLLAVKTAESYFS